VQLQHTSWCENENILPISAYILLDDGMCSYIGLVFRISVNRRLPLSQKASVNLKPNSVLSERQSAQILLNQSISLIQPQTNREVIKATKHH